MQALGQQLSWPGLSRSSYLRTANAEAFSLLERGEGDAVDSGFIFSRNQERNCQFTGKVRRLAEVDLLEA